MQTPAGRYLLAWEQAQADAHVADVFGFHALQLGLQPLDALRHNRMPNRWLAIDALAPAQLRSAGTPPGAGRPAGGPAGMPPARPAMSQAAGSQAAESQAAESQAAASHTAASHTAASQAAASQAPASQAAESAPALVVEHAEAEPSDGIATADTPVRNGRSAPQGAAGYAMLRCDFDALPFPNQSLDLVVLPHALELAHDPHHTLHEVARVLMPEGRALIFGFNPASLWAMRQRFGRLHRGMGLARERPLFLPRGGEFLGYWRLRDWLRLLSFEIEGGRFGCYRPPFSSEPWLQRFGWMEPAGYRWWPVFGAVYMLVAVKRVRGMRLVGLAKAERKPHAAPAVVANHRQGAPLTHEHDQGHST